MDALQLHTAWAGVPYSCAPHGRDTAGCGPAHAVVRAQDLHYYDCLRANKATMAWGVEVRVPFLDKEFLDTALGVFPPPVLDPPLRFLDLPLPFVDLARPPTAFP